MAKKKKVVICRNCKAPMTQGGDVCQSCGAKNKKPFHKKWWFWVIIVLVLIAGVSGGDDEKEMEKKVQEEVQKEDTQEPQVEVKVEEDEANQEVKEEADPATSSSETAEAAYKRILDEYTIKIKEATPGLIQEYKKEAPNNTGGLEGLAELSNAKVAKLAEINNDGVGEMASVMLKKGSGSYEDYEEWAGKLMEVYMDEAGKIMEEYMNSAM